MATYQRRKTWGWRPSGKCPFHNDARIVCDQMSCLPSSRTEPSRRLGCCLRWSQVSVRSQCARYVRLISFYSRWIYAQFIAVDANFKLKSKNRRINDPELGSGWSYFVENKAYTRHVAKSPDDQEVGCAFDPGSPTLTSVLGYELRH